MFKKDGFTVIMPTFNQCGFIRRAIESLIQQTFDKWELIIVNDGCTDETEDFLKDYLSYPNIRYLKNECNTGLGCALNRGMEHAAYDRIAYLPSDDFYYANHLQSLHEQFENHPDTVLAVSGIRYDSPDSLNPVNDYKHNSSVPGHCLQLVQCAHRFTEDRWTERGEFVTYDLFAMFWHKLASKGIFSYTGAVTCNWTNHPDQRHKLIREDMGGNNYAYRSFYGVKEPVKIKVEESRWVDERKLYAGFRASIPPGERTEKKIKVLLVGDLSHNPERICALEQHGYELYGLWVQKPSFFTGTGPLSFGNVKDIPYENRYDAIRKIKPDIIYAQSNTIAIPLAHEVLTNKGDVPMVWHFKEGPFVGMKRGHHAKLIDLYTRAEGVLYVNPEMKRWYETYTGKRHGLSGIMDGDMPPKAYFTDRFSPKLSAVDCAFHTVAPGRIVGISPDEMRQFAEHNIHVHLYTTFHFHRRANLVESMKKAAPLHFHLHPHCDSENWVEEFSRYDAGWLHRFESENEGDILRATWDDLNMPCRMNTLAAAGLPMIQYDNSGHIVAMQEHIKKIDCGIFYKDAKDLREQLANSQRMETLRRNVIQNRFRFCFDEYVPCLTDFFNQVITNTKKR